MPWYSVFGNHDGLVQGNFPPTLQLGVIATGPLKATALPPGLSQADVISSLTAADSDRPARRAGSPAPARQGRRQAQGAHPQAGRRGALQHQPTPPVGHGFTAENKAKGTAYYTFDKGLFRGIVLDSVNPNGYAEGSLGTTQMAWLETTLPTRRTST